MSKPKPTQACLDQLRKRYAQARKRHRTVILDEFVAASGYNRKHAIALLRGHHGWRRGGTKTCTLLQRQIPVRTFADWDDKRPVLEEIDLVQHDGGVPTGFFACTLNVTDVATGWTELRAIQNKAQDRVFTALQDIRQRLPFALLGLDSDNGAEFINDELWRHTQAEAITFTRGQVGRKNDNPFVEQKNWSVVRRMVGDERYDTPHQVRRLNRLYDLCSAYTNHFLPVSKLVAKQRDGPHVTHIYDEPKTSYQRVLNSPDVPAPVKATLTATHTALGVITLKKQIDAAIDALRPSKPPPAKLR